VIPTTKEVEVLVTTFRTEERTGTRTNWVPQPVTSTVTQSYCVMVPYTQTITVPVCPQGPGMSGGFWRGGHP
jgi:hypothetical protein